MARPIPNAYPHSHTKAVVYTYCPRKEENDSEDVTHCWLPLLSRQLPYKVQSSTWLNFLVCTILKTIWDFNMLNTFLPFPYNILRLRYITYGLDYSKQHLHNTLSIQSNFILITSHYPHDNASNQLSLQLLLALQITSDFFLT